MLKSFGYNSGPKRSPPSGDHQQSNDHDAEKLRLQEASKQRTKLGLYGLGVGAAAAGAYGLYAYNNKSPEALEGNTSSITQSTGNERYHEGDEQGETGEPTSKKGWGSLLLGLFIIMIIGLMVGVGLWYFEVLNFGGDAQDEGLDEYDLENPERTFK